MFGFNLMASYLPTRSVAGDTTLKKQGLSMQTALSKHANIGRDNPSHHFPSNIRAVTC